MARMGKRCDCCVGAKFGRLTVVGTAKLLWRCGATKSCYLRAVPVRCDCGVTKEVWEHHLLAGRVRSCGCLRREVSVKKATTHGQRHTRLYTTWVNMRRRCEYPRTASYRYYGERGIKVCRTWQVFENFAVWAKESGYRYPLTIERRNNNRNYCPSNCRWIPMADQSKHRRKWKRQSRN